MRERHGADQTGRFSLQVTCRLQHRCGRLTGAIGVYRIEIVLRMREGVHGHIADAAGDSCHVGRHPGSRAGDGAVGLVSLHQAADILVERQVEAHVARHVTFIPAGGSQGPFGRAVGEHEYDIFRGADLTGGANLTGLGAGCRKNYKGYGGKKESFQHIRKDTKSVLNV